MSFRNCPHAIGEIFSIGLDELEIDESLNVRRIDRRALRELAESMRADRGGQMHAVQVCWTGSRYAVAVGFRRALAKWLFREEMGFKTIDVRLITPEEAPLRRLSENYDRAEPPSFDTCKYLFNLATGSGGHPKQAMQDIANAIHMSVGHTENLIRFYRELPNDLRSLWAADEEGRFTYRILNRLATLSRAGRMDEVRALAMDLAAPRASSGDSISTVASPPPIGPEFFAPIPDRRPRTGFRRRVSDLAERLTSAGRERIAEDDRAVLIFDLLQSLSGELPKKRADEIIDTLLADLAASTPNQRRK